MKGDYFYNLSQSQLMNEVEQISDKIEFLYYNVMDVIKICNQLLEVDLKTCTYEVREQILYTLCNAVEYYGVRNQLNLLQLISLKNSIEKDLQEYIDEIVYG